MTAQHNTALVNVHPRSSRHISPFSRLSSRLIIGLLLLFSGGSFNAFATDEAGIDESKWGLGITGTYDLGFSDRIVSAEISNGIVRVSGDNNFSARLLLERHFFTKTDAGTCFLFSSANGCGGFLAIQMGSTNTKVLDAFGFGYMWGWKDNKDDKATAWNFGLGLIADPNTTVLGDGIVKNEALPAGETLRYKTTTKFGVLMLFSFGL